MNSALWNVEWIFSSNIEEESRNKFTLTDWNAHSYGLKIHPKNESETTRYVKLARFERNSIPGDLDSIHGENFISIYFIIMWILSYFPKSSSDSEWSLDSVSSGISLWEIQRVRLAIVLVLISVSNRHRKQFTARRDANPIRSAFDRRCKIGDGHPGGDRSICKSLINVHPSDFIGFVSIATAYYTHISICSRLRPRPRIAANNWN